MFFIYQGTGQRGIYRNGHAWKGLEWYGSIESMNYFIHRVLYKESLLFLCPWGEVFIMGKKGKSPLPIFIFLLRMFFSCFFSPLYYNTGNGLYTLELPVTAHS